MIELGLFTFGVTIVYIPMKAKEKKRKKNQTNNNKRKKDRPNSQSLQTANIEMENRLGNQLTVISFGKNMQRATKRKTLNEDE